MADGSYRFHQTGAGPFQHHNNQFNPHRNLPRATSPHGSRRPFSNDTPSPSRSPSTSTMSHNFNMYNQNGYHNSQAMMNGGQNHQRYGGMQMPKYQQPHNSHHNQLNHHQTQHHGGNYGHQHTHSSSGFSATQHLGNFGQEHGQNGHMEGVPQEDIDEYTSEHWRQQIQLSKDIQGGSSPNHQARMMAQQSKSSNMGAIGQFGDEQGTESRSRPYQKKTETRPDWESLDLGGQGLRALSMGLYNYMFLRKLYLSHNNLDRLPRQISRLKNLTLLDVSHNELTHLPEEIGMLTRLEELLLFGNRIQTLPFEIGFLFNLKMLGVVGNPLDEEYTSKIKEDSSASLIRYIRENMPDLEPPNEREWHIMDSAANSSNDVEKFKALSYNILCERFATTQQYGYVAERTLSWEYRKELILDEIRSHDADIVCLQELDRLSNDEFFRGNLSQAGYNGCIAQKSRSENMAQEQAKYVDGCGTFWKDKKYILLNKQSFNLGRKATYHADVKQRGDDMINRVFSKDHIASVVLLENRVTGTRLIVANTHLFWDPAYKDVKLIQATILMEELKKISAEYAKIPPCLEKKTRNWSFTNADDSEPTEPDPEPGPSKSYDEGNQIPMIMCGDFNSSPNSAVYDLFVKKKLEANHPDLVNWDYGFFTTRGMEHPFSLQSSYNEIGELPFTNYTPEFTAVLDYIWYSTNSLRVVGLLGQVDESYVSKVPGFPSQHFPSDHLALLTEFVIRERKKPTQALDRRDVDFGSSSRNGPISKKST